jgi:hypothetical protein
MSVKHHRERHFLKQHISMLADPSERKEEKIEFELCDVDGLG